MKQTKESFQGQEFKESNIRHGENQLCQRRNLNEREIQNNKIFITYANGGLRTYNFIEQQNGNLVITE